MTQNFGKVATALGLFVSCIKSGESWTATCEAANKEAHEAMIAIGADQQEIMRINNGLRTLLLATRRHVPADLLSEIDAAVS